MLPPIHAANDRSPVVLPVCSLTLGPGNSALISLSNRLTRPFCCDAAPTMTMLLSSAGRISWSTAFSDASISSGMTCSGFGAGWSSS